MTDDDRKWQYGWERAREEDRQRRRRADYRNEYRDRDAERGAWRDERYGAGGDPGDPYGPYGFGYGAGRFDVPPPSPYGGRAAPLGQDYYGYYGYRGDRYGDRGYGARSGGYRGERGFFERAGDEIASWFGDDDAERRRRRDAESGDSSAQHHRGRGPKGYRRSEDRIHEDVCDRLTDDPYLDASDIEINVQGGEVTLFGTVDSRMAKRRAEDIADDISGVTHVQNNLRVRRQGPYGTDVTVEEGDVTSAAQQQRRSG